MMLLILKEIINHDKLLYSYNKYKLYNTNMVVLNIIIIRYNNYIRKQF